MPWEAGLGSRVYGPGFRVKGVGHRRLMKYCLELSLRLMALSQHVNQKVPEPEPRVNKKKPLTKSQHG